MNVAALIFLIVAAGSVVLLPRRWAPIPLLVSCCYMTLGQGIHLGPLTLPVFRLVLAAGFVRVVLRGERPAGGINAIDKLIVVWALWMIFAGFFHEWNPGSGPIYASGFAFNVLLVYFLTRAWCESLADLMAVLRTVAWLLIPVAAAMVTEHVLQKEYFGLLFGGESDGSVIWRDGKIRARGPFAHPILAGTVGAVCFPLMIGLWRQYRLSALVGMAACLTMVTASSSSGPLMSLFIGILGLFMWSHRRWLRTVRWALVGAYLCAEVLMSRPAYYLMSKFDLTGSSTGWHRSRLIEAAIENFSDWWLFGTDYTFHWIGIAVDEAGRHSDIVNYYLWFGVIGGFPAMLLLIAMIWRAFVWVGTIVANDPAEFREHRFMIWCLGSGLLAHTVTSLSVSYMDQSLTFFWLNIAAISSMHSIVTKNSTGKAPEPTSKAKRETPLAGRPGPRSSLPGGRQGWQPRRTGQ